MRSASTDAEGRLWSRLRNRQLGFEFRRRHRIGGYIVEFVCNERNLAVEVEGGRHPAPAEYDAQRAAHLESAGLRVLRFRNRDVLTKTDDVLETIWRALQDASPRPRKQGRGSRGAAFPSIGTRLGAPASMPETDRRQDASHRSPSPPPAGAKAGTRGSAPDDWRPSANLDAIRLRARLNALFRDFFAQRGVLEVETPVMSMAGNTDPNIASFHLEFSGRTDGAPRTRWLRTSPEFPLKRLLAAGIGDCYELGRVFRDGEAGGRHNPEFTMLEWYRVGWDHMRLIDEAVELVRAALALVGRDATVEKCSFRDLYRERLGIDPLLASLEELRNAGSGIAIDGAGLTRDDWLDLLMTHRLQPSFPGNRLLAVHDYPASQSALARIREPAPAQAGDPPVAERFELYLGPLELANGYHELDDAAEQRKRFERDLDVRRSRGDAAPPLDERLLEALPSLPDCAGVALGVDRLLMALLRTERISGVLAFDFGRA
jgi:lysyl-tRNA synthetase class 2